MFSLLKGCPTLGTRVQGSVANFNYILYLKMYNVATNMWIKCLFVLEQNIIKRIQLCDIFFGGGRVRGEQAGKGGQQKDESVFKLQLNECESRRALLCVRNINFRYLSKNNKSVCPHTKESYTHNYNNYFCRERRKVGHLKSQCDNFLH